MSYSRCRLPTWRRFEQGVRKFRSIIPALLLMASVGYTAANTLESVSVEVHPLAGDRFRVQLEMTYDRATHPEGGFRHFALRRGNVEISGLVARTDDSEMNATLRELPSQFQLEISPGRGVSHYSIEYRVTLADATRIPIFVPSSPIQGAVTIRAFSGEEYELVGTTFPRFYPAGANLETRLGNLPSFLIVPLREKSTGNFLDRLRSVSFLTDAGLVAIVLAVSFYWWRLRRRALRTLAESNPDEGGLS